MSDYSAEGAGGLRRVRDETERMGAMVTEQREREDKFDVHPGFVVPELVDLLPEGGGIETATYQLDNTYYDTADGDLGRARLTLRQRVGGPDAGWHLKIPAGIARTEIHSKSRRRTVPKGLSNLVRGVTRGHQLAPIANLRTSRDVVRLLTAQGELMAEIADDQVESSTMGAETSLRSWREVEVELGSAGDETLLRTVGDRLVEWGAARSTSVSKLKRALGADVEPQPEPDLETVGALVAAYVSTQCTEVVNGDLGLRLGRSVVHPIRVAVRRLRSTMRVFGPVFDSEQTAALESELVWYAGVLGEVRDRDILAERLLDQVQQLPAEFVLGPVAAHIESTLQTEKTGHLKKVDQALGSERYLDLLETLNRWRSAPPFTELASAPPTGLNAYVKQAELKLDKRLRTAHGDADALHRARKAGKRFRYAAELSEPVLGKRAAKAVTAGQKIQTLLGEHQDSIVSAVFLRRLGAEAGTENGQNGFTYGILLAREWQRGKDIRRQLQKRFG